MTTNRKPFNRAFVVQLQSDPNSPTPVFEGSVEHVSSGRLVRFRSLEEMAAFMSEVLADIASMKEGEE
jgi:hypothetical protein